MVRKLDAGAMSSLDQHGLIQQDQPLRSLHLLAVYQLPVMEPQVSVPLSISLGIASAGGDPSAPLMGSLVQTSTAVTKLAPPFWIIYS